MIAKIVLFILGVVLGFLLSSRGEAEIKVAQSPMPSFEVRTAEWELCDYGGSIGYSNGQITHRIKCENLPTIYLVRRVHGRI